MKPKEFDELIRQKFDQDDFAYNPRNWDNLAEQMDGRAKKRSIIMLWLMPMAGIAASVALAIGVTTLLRQPQTGPAGGNNAVAQTSVFEKPQTMQSEPSPTMVTNNEQYPNTTAINRNNTRPQKKQDKKNAAETFAISLDNAIGFSPAKKSGFVLQDELIPKREKKAVAVNEGYNTFKPEEEIKKAPKLSIILSGGISHGSQNSGYMVGATVRRMLNDKMFIESDVAVASSNNTQSSEVFVPGAAVAARHSAARNTNIETNIPPVVPSPQGSVKDETLSYNLYYAQVSPGIGMKVIKQVSVGVGPDFQQMLADNRPAPSTVDRNNIAVAPIFDVGIIGKTEYALTKKIKAGVYYRKGINNLLTPMDKYIDRDYLQFQLKCTIFNK